MSRPAFAFGRALRTTAARRALAVGAAGVVAYNIDQEHLARAATAFSGARRFLVDRYTLHLDAAAPKAEGELAAAGSTFGGSAHVDQWAAQSLQGSNNGWPDPLDLRQPLTAVDPATSVQHPLTLTPASCPELALVGVGVRTVSFLSFKVYSAGFYANDYSLRRLRSIPGWQGYDPSEFAASRGEELVQNLMDVPTAVAVRIVPVRNTDFGHLRDGFTRTLLARARVQRQKGELTPEADEAITAAIQELKTVFPVGSVPKGNALTLVHTPSGLAVEYKGKILGTVKDKWVADNLMRAYFAQEPISPPLRGDTARGFQKYYEEN